MFSDLDTRGEPLGTPRASHGAAVSSHGRPTGVPWGARVALMGRQWGAIGTHWCSMKPHGRSMKPHWRLMVPDAPWGHLFAIAGHVATKLFGHLWAPLVAILGRSGADGALVAIREWKSRRGALGIVGRVGP